MATEHNLAHFVDPEIYLTQHFGIEILGCAQDQLLAIVVKDNSLKSETIREPFPWRAPPASLHAPYDIPPGVSVGHRPQ